MSDATDASAIEDPRGWARTVLLADYIWTREEEAQSQSSLINLTSLAVVVIGALLAALQVVDVPHAVAGDARAIRDLTPYAFGFLMLPALPLGLSGWLLHEAFRGAIRRTYLRTLERALAPGLVIRTSDAQLIPPSAIGQDDVLGLPSMSRISAYTSKLVLPEAPLNRSDIRHGRFLVRGTIITGNALLAVALLASILVCAVRVRSMYPSHDIPIWLWIVGVITFLLYLAWWVAVCVGLNRVNGGAAREWAGGVARLRHEIAGADPNIS